MIPGQGVAMVLRQSIIGGPKAAFLSSLGNCLGILIWSVSSAIGLSAIFTRSDTAYSILKWSGVLFLTFISANAKAAVYAVAFIPAFIPKETSLGFGIIFLGAVWALISILWNIGLIWTVKKSSTYIQRPSVRRALTGISAIGILGIAVGLALS